MRIDSHHHFWDPTRRDYYWMGGEALAPIRRPLGPIDLKPLISAAGISGTVIVQTIPDLNETVEFLEIADDTDFVRGVVGWVDLTAPALPSVLQKLKSGKGGKYLVGIRHQAHDEDDANWLIRPDVLAGIQHVLDAGLAYDLLLKERELPAAIKAVDALPKDARLVVDHIAKPRIAAGEMEPWKELISEISKRPNVWCKLSGMVTEANWQSWTADNLRPYAEHVIESFGADRIMFGSDWPVCLLAASYEDVVATADTLISHLSDADKAKVQGGNAEQFYRLPK